MTEAEKIVAQLHLQPHPEGGFFKETYRSDGIINEVNLDHDIKGQRHFSTAIYFLLTSKNFSAFHRIKQDEIWHFYKGSALNLHIISSEGIYSTVRIGNQFEKGDVPQFIVKARSWFAAEVINAHSYSLVGCTVSPGFDFRDFELANSVALSAKYPQYSSIITKFTKH
ncbi:cupin domain-containing protein [Aestuariivivens sediminis]|uniref:cupin domain-containing protein n=1 Tax=Aestuariivivens sediminis TaxID=2913557 RepID=UPI001F58F5B8|nr:cupin domain-containing protein [Aestuariivivens sediminis]